MALWYVDPVNGIDSNAGTSWGAACATLTGINAKSITGGDTIRVAKTNDPQDTGQTATWVSGTYPSNNWKSNSTLSITSSTNANPIVITCAAHGLSTGEYVGISGHSTNTNANGVNVITVLSTTTFSIPVTGNGVGGTTGSIYRLSNQIVTLTSAVTSVISNCETSWSVGSSTSVAVNSNTASKEGNGSAKLTITTPATSTKLAYVLTANTNYSSYNQISFWITNTAVVTAGQYILALCSDTAGATVLYSLGIPAIPSTGQWVAFTMDNGSALGSSIQSVALYTGSTTGTSNVLSIDHIIACGPSSSASSLSLTSLISVNDGNQGWFNIRSINGTTINLDHGNNSNWLASRGFYGTTQNVELYKRETFKQAMVAANYSTTNSLNGSNLISKNGSNSGSQLTFSGGWNIATNLQDGTGNGANQTYWDGQNGYGSGISGPCFATISWVTVTGINCSRFYFAYGCYPNYPNWTNCTFSAFNHTNNYSCMTSNFTNSSMSFNNVSLTTSDAISIGGSNTASGTFTIANLFAIGPGSGTGNAFTVNSNLPVIAITNFIAGCNNGISNQLNGNVSVPLVTGCIGTGIQGTFTVPTTTSLVLSAITNCGTGLNLSGTNTLLMRNLTFSGNTTDITLNNSNGTNYLVDSTYSVAPSITSSLVNEYFFIRNPNSTVSALAYSDSMSCNTDTTTIHTTGNRTWKIATSRTSSTYPALLPLGYIVLQGSVTNTITAWVYYSSAGMICGIQIVGGQVEGMTTTQLATTTGTINTWTQVTLTITAATQSGPVQLQAYGLSSSGTQNMWVADIGVS